MNLYIKVKNKDDKIENVPNIELFQLKLYVLNKILEKNYFENEAIYKNKDKINILTNLILYPESESQIDYILNLLTSTKLNNESHKNEIDKLSPFKEIDYKYVCIENLKLIGKLSLKEKEIYNYDYQIKLCSEMIKDIKDFLKEILNAKVFDDAFKILYGNDFDNVFKNDKFRNYYFDNYVKFVPFKSFNSSGFTDKYTLKSYIFLKERNKNVKILENEIKSLIIEALTIGSFLDVIFHEINHFIYALLFISDKNKSYSFLTPRKLKLSNIREGGYYFELLLFGKIINNMSFKEALYLLNKNNYAKSLKEFKNGFTYLKKNDVEATGKFEKFNNLIYNNLEYENSSIVVKSNEKCNLLDDTHIEIYKNNCTCVNRNIDLNELKKFKIIKD